VESRVRRITIAAKLTSIGIGDRLKAVGQIPRLQAMQSLKIRSGDRSQ